MDVWRTSADVPVDLPGSVVAVGVFDGVHRGHRVVLARAGEHARRLAVPLVVLTFDPHPLTVLRPDAAPPALTTLEHRLALFEQAAADAAYVMRFDSSRSQQSAEDFVTDTLVRTLHACAVVVGEDFRFGRRAAGDVTLLRRMGADLGFALDAIRPVGDGERWSSSRVRELLAGGDVAAAAQVLARPHRVAGVVVEGDHRGRALGYPTANVPAPEGFAVPADGVYAGWLRRLDRPGSPAMPAAISVGSNPTFDGTQRRVEAYVLDRDDLELYGVPVAVEFVARVRAQERFDSVDQLVEQIGRDVEDVRVALAAD